MQGESPSQGLARFAVETDWRDLPPSIIHETKRVIMDSIGCALGALSVDKGKMYAALGRRYGGPPESSIIGVGDRVSLNTATLVNGELMFTLDYHNIMSNAHDGVYVLPTILAIAESTGASGKELILASALGFEISSRLARAVLRHPIGAMSQVPRPTERMRTGNAHSNFGAAAGAGKLMKFNREKMLHAMGIAGHLCMVLTYGRWGNPAYNYMAKYGVPGWQSTGAMTAVMLADMGYTGDTTILDSENGFAYICGYPEWHPELIMEDIGQAWWFNYRLHYKPYPCCGVFHCALDCFYDIIEQNNLRPEEIDSIKAFMRAMVSKPLTPQELENISAAQFSPPYVFSVAANRVRRGPEWHDKATVRDPEILKFMPKLTCQPHPDYEKTLAQDPMSALSKCEVAARGRTFTVERKYRRGTTGTEAAPTDEEIIAKFKHNAARILTQEKIDRAVKALSELEKIDHISEVMKEITL